MLQIQLHRVAAIFGLLRKCIPKGKFFWAGVQFLPTCKQEQAVTAQTRDILVKSNVVPEVGMHQTLAEMAGRLAKFLGGNRMG